MDASTHFEQNARGAMTYPSPGTLNRILFKTPLIWWRMGLGGMLGKSMIVLTTWGRRSRVPRHTMLSYTPLAGRIYIGAGWGAQCDWCQNLLADPHVTVQVHSKEVTGENSEVAIHAVARLVTDENEFRQVSKRLFETGGDSHFRPYLKSLDVEYDHADMVAKRDRFYQIALDLQSPEPGSALALNTFPAPLEKDLKWVWLVMAGSFCLGWLIGRRRA